MGTVTFWILVVAGVLFAVMALLMVLLMVITQIRRTKQIEILSDDTAPDIFSDL